MITTNYIIMLSVFIIYVSMITARYGVLNSISHSYYALPGRWNVLFTLFCWGFAFPAMVIGSELNSLLLIFSGIAICFVGAAPAFKVPVTEQVHKYAAFISVFLSQAAILLEFKMYWLNILFGIAVLLFMLYKHKTKETFWIEVCAFTSICIALFFHL